MLIFLSTPPCSTCVTGNLQGLAAGALRVTWVSMCLISAVACMYRL